MARKVNKKFVAILVAGLVCLLIVAGGGLLYWRHKHDPRRTVAAAENFEKQGDYLDAANYYANAANRMHDPKIWTAAGDDFNKILYSDDENVKKMMGCYDGALGIDPNYLPALEAKLSFYQEAMKDLPGFHSPSTYDSIGDISRKILAADPSNKAAKIAIPVTVIDGFQNRFDTDPEKVNASIKDLQVQQQKDPTNADIPYYMAVAYEGLAAGATRDGKTADADKDNAQALAVMEPAVKANDNSPAFHFRAAKIYISQIHPGMTDAQAQPFMDRAKAEGARAGQLVQPNDPQFAEIKLLQGNMIHFGGKDVSSAQMLDQLVKLYQDALAAKPEALPIRIQLADTLGKITGHRDEAIELLKNIPPATVEQQSGPRGLVQHNLELQALVDLTNLRLDKYFTLQSESEKQVLLGQIEQDYRKIEVKAATAPDVLQLKAKLQLAQNEPGDAIMTLDQAIAKIDARSPMYYQLMFLEAKACLQTDQPGLAKKNLQQIADHTDFVPARILLAETLLKEFDYKGAADNVKWLVDHHVTDPDVVRMQMALLAHDNKPDDMKKIYATLPEQNRAQKLDKAGIAAVMSLPDETKRLLQSVLTADPGDVEAVLMLAQFDLRNKDSAGASAVVDAGLKVKPTNPDLLLTKAHLNGSSPEDIRKIQMQEAQNIPDPLERELRLFDLTRGDKDESVPLGHLAAAEKANPNDLRVLNFKFDYSLIIHKWDQAAIYADKLAKIDADKVQGNLYQWRIAMEQARNETDKDKALSDVNRAREIAVKLTQNYPVYARSWVCMAQTMQALGQYQEAITAYQEAKTRQPESVETYQGIIECYYALNQPTDAGKTIAEAVDRMPMYPGFKELQMQHEMKYGNPEKVVADREKNVADAPDVEQNWKALAATYESVAQQKANTPGKENEANAWFEKAKNTLAQGAQKFPDDLTFVAEHGAVCALLKEVDQGEKLWLTALAMPQFKDKPQVISAFALFYVRSGRAADADKVLQNYLATPAGKNNADIAMNLCELLVNQGKPDAAMAVLDNFPNDQRLQLRKAEILIMQSKYADAEKLINSLIQAGKTPQLLSSLGFVYLHTNRAKQAMDILNEALVAAPNYPNALYYRALATTATGGKIDSAIADLTTVRNEAPSMFNARYELIGDLLAAGRRDAAIKELEAILRDDPSQKSARIQLLALYSQPPSPQWIDAERIAKDADANLDLANDLDIKIAEAQMWSARGMSQKAIDVMQKPLADQPNNMYVLQTYYNVLLKADRYQQVLDDTDKLSGDTKDQPWVHSLRGMAKTKLGDKDGGTAEFNTALAQCIKSNDNGTAAHVCQQIVDSAGLDSALRIISALPQSSEPFWQFQTAQFYFKKSQIPDARKAMDKVMANITKLSKEQQVAVLGFAGSLYMQTPDPDFAKARDIYLQLLRLTPEDYRVYNNLACNVAVSPSDSLDYSQKAYELMKKTENYDPLVADTYGWNLVQNANNRVDDGITVLLDAWKARQIVDIAYHLGAAYLKKGNPDEANRYLTQAQSLFNDELKNNTVTDATLQQKIIDAQHQANDRKAKTGP